MDNLQTPKTPKEEMGMKIKMLKAEAYNGIVAFYDAIARRLGYNIDRVNYDCSKIDVSENIFNEIEQWYKDNKNSGPEQIGMIWVCYGPKVNSELTDYEVVIEEGFIGEVEVCQ